MEGQFSWRITRLQSGDDIAVNLDDLQMIQKFQQWVSQRSKSRTYLNDTIVTLQCDCIDNSGYHLSVNQEILPKTFAWNMLVHAAYLNSNASEQASPCQRATLEL
ncbi:hypothetical protein PROAA_1060004 [Candidatus Propionivibrio aalborgensis]|uniref:Uncharacterized protein n=1 Tax=Candidatus Propionivibrio aalborgensis TaxID=1860101 RepID=A0A1A8XGD9_9RHOO|nr:hypothetical protein PROAA_1060004 [Candidatus Propionivibrio aalborgensis]